MGITLTYKPNIISSTSCATIAWNNRDGDLPIAFRPLLCIRIDEETELRIYEERHAQEVAELVDQNRAYLRQWLPWIDKLKIFAVVLSLKGWGLHRKGS